MLDCFCDSENVFLTVFRHDSRVVVGVWFFVGLFFGLGGFSAIVVYTVALSEDGIP